MSRDEIYLQPYELQKGCFNSPKYKKAQAEYNAYHSFMRSIKLLFGYNDNLNDTPQKYPCPVSDIVKLINEECPEGSKNIPSYVYDDNNTVVVCLTVFKDVYIDLAQPYGPQGS